MAALVLILTMAAVFILLPGFWAVMLFLSIVWMYRPDLTVMDIIRGVMRELWEEQKETREPREQHEEQEEQEKKKDMIKKKLKNYRAAARSPAERKQTMSKIITCEQVSNGHPDKICDQIADAIVTDCLQHDKNSRVAIEVLIKDDQVIIAGELTSKHEPDYEKLVDEVFERIGNEKLDYGVAKITLLVKQQSPDIALGVDKGGAGDQGMMYGYATNETPELLPIPFVLATRFLEKLRDCGDERFKADAKAQVSFDYETGSITTFLCSVQHTADVEPSDFHSVIEELMKETATEYGLNTDFQTLVNPTGRFVIGGSFADCGVTGRKLACDTYGGVGHIGGGAMSGKDPSKVDRSGAYAARKVAADIVRAGYADKAEVQIAYAIGVAEPVGINVETFGTEHKPIAEIEAFVRSNYDLTPKGIIKSLHLLDVDYNKVSAYGHFGKRELPWEQ